jgi:hypothetical protein
MGMQHPNPDVPAMAMAAKAIALSEELGLRDRSVHFNMGWVPYDRRQDFLLEADVGISTHFDHIETAFSFRTRILDYIWAGLPVVATEGDEFARLIVDRGLGRVVRYGDDRSIADAISELFEQPSELRACADAVKRAQPDFTWETTLRPLVRYCADPYRAADLVDSPATGQDLARDAERTLGSLLAPPGLLPRMAFFIRREGVAGFVGRVVRTARRRIARRVAGEKV